MGKASGRKRARVSLGSIEFVRPTLDGSHPMTSEVAKAIVGSEFIFAQARRHAEALATSMESGAAREFLMSLAVDLEQVERWIRPSAGRALEALGLPDDHALRNDGQAYRQGVDPLGVVQRVAGQFVAGEAGAAVAKQAGRPMVSIEVDDDGIVRESVPDELLGRSGGA